MSTEACGFLTRLRFLGILDEEVLEEVILKAEQMAEDQLSLKEIKTLTVLTLFARSHNEWCREFDYMLEDDWSRLLN